MRASYSVVIMTRDRRDELLRTLALMTALPEDPPVFVVDNASTDGTAAAVAAAYPRVRLLRADRNLGAVARNVAVERVTTPYVAFCDDDTWWDPASPGRAAELLDTHPRLASVTARILVEPGGTEDPLTPELRYSPLPRPCWLPGTALLSVLAGASMLRVSAFREAGGFSPKLWLGGEEELLSLDLAAAGWWLCWCEELTVHHQASTARDPRHRRRIGIRNTLWTALLRRPWSDLLPHARTVLASAPRDRTTLAALAETALGVPWALRNRRPLPPRVAEAARLLREPQRGSPARRYVG